MKKLVSVLLTLAVVLGLSLVAAVPVAAADVNPGESIQAAIDNATAGDTINVAAGTYVESITIDVENLTLLGAQAGVDPTVEGARTDETAESIINGSINIGADNVTIDGFKVTSNEGDGIIIEKPSEKHTIRNNCIVSNKANGINFGVDTHGTTVKNNYIALNGKSGIESGKRAYDITIENNHITLNEVNGILLKSKNHGIRIEKNTITLNVRRGIWLFEWGNNNPIHHNNIYGNTEYGIEAFWPSTTEVEFTEVDATNNWWGSPTGPYDPNGVVEVPPCNDKPANDKNANGVGDNVSDNVDYCPWLGSPVGTSSGPVSLTVDNPQITGISVTPTAIDFGTLLPGDSSSVTTLTISNIGTVDVKVTTSITDETGTFFTDNLYLTYPKKAVDYVFDPLTVGGSATPGAKVVVPSTYPAVGSTTGTLTFEATAK